jgi:hypothetical protein
MKFDLKSLLAAALACALVTAPALAAETEPLALKLPGHTPKGTPEDLPSGSNVEPIPTKAPKPLDVPKGVKNVAAGKTVTSSVAPFLGELNQITEV